MSFRRVEGNKVVFDVQLTAPCPCGTGIAASQCCFRQQAFKKLPATTNPKSPRTNVSRIGCYAAPLQDCSNDISREHYLSKSILVQLEQLGGLRISGTPWMPPGETRIVAPNALTAKVLCSRHNTALSPLDHMAARLFKAFDDSDAVGGAKDLLYLFSGHDVERWLLKVLCGCLFSGIFTPDHKNVPLPISWLNVLFGKEEFSGLGGLYVINELGTKQCGPTGVWMTATTRNEDVSGLSLHVCATELVLNTLGIPQRKFMGRRCAYRPFEIHTRGKQYEKSVIFTWFGHSDGGTIGTLIGEAP